MAQHSCIEELDVQAVWNGEKCDPVVVNIKLQIRATANSKIPIFRCADEHVVAATPLTPRLVTTQPLAADWHSSERDRELTASPRRRLFPANPTSLYDVDPDAFNNIKTRSPTVVGAASGNDIQTPFEPLPVSPDPLHPSSITYINLSEAQRESSGSTVDILLPSEEGTDDDSDTSSITLVRYGGLLRETRSSLSPEPATMPSRDLRVSRKRESRVGSNLNKSRSRCRNSARKSTGYDNGEASTSNILSDMGTSPTQEHSRIASEVLNVSRTFKSSASTKRNVRPSPKKPQWQSPSQADFSPKESRTRLQASSNTHGPTPAGGGTPMSSHRHRQKQAMGKKPAHEVLEGSPTSGLEDNNTLLSNTSMSKSMKNLERVAQWRNSCPSGLVEDCALQTPSIVDDAPRMISLEGVSPTSPPVQYAENMSLPFTLEESGIIWAFCPCDVIIGLFEIEVIAEIMVTPETESQWPSLQIPGLPLQDNVQGRFSFIIETQGAPAVEFDTGMLEGALTTATSVKGEFPLDGPLWLCFRLKQRVYQPQNYQIRCDLQAVFDLTTTDGIWAMYKAAIELPQVPQNVFAEQFSITLTVNDGPKQAAAYRLGPDQSNRQIGLVPTQGEGSVDLVLDWRHGDDLSIMHLCFDIFLGGAPRIITVPMIKAQYGKVEQGIRVMEPMPPLLMDFPIHLVPTSWEHRIQKSSVGKIHEFVRKSMPRTFPTDLEAPLKAKLSALEPAVFSDLDSSDDSQDAILAMRVALSEMQGATGNMLECELNVTFMVTKDTANRELISFVSVDWTPKIAFVDGRVTGDGQFYINPNGELALLRTENIRPGETVELMVVWTLEKSDADWQSYDTEDSAVVEYDLPRIVGKTVLRPSLECDLKGASMVSYSPPNGSVSHRFDDGKVTKLPRLRPGYRLVLEKLVSNKEYEDYQHPLSTSVRDDGKKSGFDLAPSRPRKIVRFAVDEKAERIARVRSNPVLLTALLTILLLSAMAVVVDYSGMTGKTSFRTSLGRFNGALSNLSISPWEHRLPTTGNHGMAAVSISNEDEEQFWNGFSEKPLHKLVEAGGEMPTDMQVGLAQFSANSADKAADQQDVVSTKQGWGFRDMIDHALGWKGEK
ncbi:MAG: hypothetical protein M1835_005081 [Candelina submexicana]|nr:MAG: hypothetical protein M1835_005081 [Candelina submexicana]